MDTATRATYKGRGTPTVIYERDVESSDAQTALDDAIERIELVVGYRAQICRATAQLMPNGRYHTKVGYTTVGR